MTATQATTGADHQARIAALYELRPSQAFRCPRVVAGGRCLAHSRHHGSCICADHAELLDHCRIWRDPAGRHVLTAEPYGASGDAIAAFLRDLAGLGLTASLSGRSHWAPGSTIMILVRRPGGTAAATFQPQPLHCAGCGNELGKRADHFLLDDSRVFCRRCYKADSPNLCEQLEAVGQRAAIARAFANLNHGSPR